jgi:CheY-like chemotaxis protein
VVHSSAQAKPLKDKSVLVVDENSYARKLVVDMCRNLGFGAVETARCTAHALEVLADAVFDCIVCDWGTLAPDGPDFARAVRDHENAALRQTPIILMKVKPAEMDVVAARGAGVTKLLVRPFSTQMLLDSLPASLKA